MTTDSLFSGIPLVPVVTIEDPAHAQPLAETLIAAGIGAIEITLRSERALEAIEHVARQVPEIKVGAGSVRKPAHFQQVSDAGASFCVSPGVSEGLLRAAQTCGIPFIPGASTASEILHLFEQGYQFVKFFPAENLGGISTLKALSAPLPELRFFPTGGISEDNALGYLRLDCVVCVGGSWFLPSAHLRAGDFSAIRKLADQALKNCRE